MFSPAFLPMPTLLLWAKRPWDFWYPPTTGGLNLAGSILAFKDLAGDLSPSTAFAADTANFIALSGDLAPSTTFAADSTNFLLPGLAGDLSPSTAFAADTANFVALSGDLASSISFAGTIANPVVVQLTSASTSPWTIPAGVTSLTLEMQGCGGKGAAGTSAVPGGSGGSGCYGRVTITGLTPGNTIAFSVPAAGSQAATWFSSSSAYSVDYGRDASGASAGAAGATSNNIGMTVNTAGAAGVAGIASSSRPGAAGPGAPGPQGAGGAGGAGQNTLGAGGSGGGGANGGAAGSQAPAAGPGAGAAGGNGFGGSGGGVAGAVNGGAGSSGTAGTGGGGGGGGGLNASGNAGAGGNGADDTANTGYPTYGPGGGGGGGGSEESSTVGTAGVGGNGGSGAGGGGGGAGRGSSSGAAGGLGGQGLITITTLTGSTVDLAGDLSLSTAFAADTANLLALAGDLSPSIAFAAPTVASDKALVGDLAPSTTFAADTANFMALSGDLAPSVAFAASGIITNSISISLGATGPAINPNLWGVNYSWNLVPQASFAAWDTMYETTIGCLSYTHPSGWNGENYLWDTNTMKAWANWTPGGSVGEAVVPFAAAVSPGAVCSVLPAEDYILGKTNPATSAPWTLSDMVARIQAIFTGGYAAGVGSVILGNEFWNYAGANNVATRQTLLASYCTLAANIIPWIRTNYPSVKIYVTGEWLSQTNWVTGAAQPWGITTDFAQLQSQISALSTAAWSAIDGVAIHNYAGTDTAFELWSQIAPTVASIQSITGKTVISTEWAATKDRTDQDSSHNYKFGVKNTQVMLLIADQMAMSGVQAAAFWPDCYGSVNIAMADATFTVVQFNGQLMKWLAGQISGTYLNVNDAGYPSIASVNAAGQATLIFAAAQDGALNVSLAMGSYTNVASATVMYHPTPNTNTNDYTALTTPLSVTVAGGNATFTLNPGGAGRGPGWEIAILTLYQVGNKDFVGDLSPSVGFAASLASDKALAGDLSPSTTFAGETADYFALVGDLSPSTIFGAAIASDKALVGDLAPSAAFAADLTTAVGVGSQYGKNAYGVGMYSRQYPAAIDDLVGDLPVIPAFAGKLTSTLFIGAVGGDADLAPSIAFGADLSTSAPIDLTTGDLSPSVAFGGNTVTFLAVLAGAIDLTSSIAFDDLELDLTFQLSGDLAPSTAFAADMSSLPSTSMQGDLAPSVVLAADLSVDAVLAGDLSPSTIFAAGVSLSFNLAGDLPVTPAFAATMAPFFGVIGDLPPQVLFNADITITSAKDLAGDLSFSATFAATPAGLLALAGNLAPDVEFPADLTVSTVTGSHYGKASYGLGPYSQYAPGPQPMAGALAPAIAFAATLGVTQVLAGDLAPSVAFGGDFDINNQKTLNGALAPSVTFGASLSVSITLAGNLSPSIALSGVAVSNVPIAGGLACSIALAGDMTSGPLWQGGPPAAPPWQSPPPRPPSIWTPIDSTPVDWEEVEPCRG